jgi:hypothetical protein
MDEMSLVDALIPAARKRHHPFIPGSLSRKRQGNKDVPNAIIRHSPNFRDILWTTRTTFCGTILLRRDHIHLYDDDGLLLRVALMVVCHATNVSASFPVSGDGVQRLSASPVTLNCTPTLLLRTSRD